MCTVYTIYIYISPFAPRPPPSIRTTSSQLAKEPLMYPYSELATCAVERIWHTYKKVKTRLWSWRSD